MGADEEAAEGAGRAAIEGRESKERQKSRVQKRTRGGAAKNEKNKGRCNGRR